MGTEATDEKTDSVDIEELPSERLGNTRSRKSVLRKHGQQKLEVEIEK